MCKLSLMVLAVSGSDLPMAYALPSGYSPWRSQALQ